VKGFLLAAVYGAALAVVWWFIAHNASVSIGTFVTSIALASWGKYAHEWRRFAAVVVISLVYALFDLYVFAPRPH
jgi:hypothetical protein